MKGILTTAVAISATALSLAAPAQAYREVYVTTIVDWGGTDCLQYESTNVYNPYDTGLNSQCNATHELVWQQYASSEQQVGVNPIMGANSWIRCQVIVDGVLEWTDHADAGDGHDVNCLRTVRW